MIVNPEQAAQMAGEAIAKGEAFHAEPVHGDRYEVTTESPMVLLWTALNDDYEPFIEVVRRAGLLG